MVIFFFVFKIIFPEGEKGKVNNMKHKDLIDKMTIEEKAAFLSGVSEWESREIKKTWD